MKKKKLLLMILFLVMGMMSGCKKNNLPECYEGEVVLLGINDVDRQKQLGLIKIKKSISNGLSVNKTIAFDPDLLNQDLKVGDILNFKVVELCSWQHSTGLFPDSKVFLAEIKLCNE